jgi:hypothetical protein
MHLEGQRLVCWGRRQANGCRVPSVREEIIVDELGAYLRQLEIPEEAKRRILDAYHRVRPEAAAKAAERRGVEAHLRRLTDVYLLGDLSKVEYERKRADLKMELTHLDEADVHGRPEVLDRLREFLLDAAEFWTERDAAQRNRLATALFEVVFIKDGHIFEVRPRPEFQPYFVLASEPSPPTNRPLLSPGLHQQTEATSVTR